MIQAKNYISAASVEEAYTLLTQNANSAILGGGMWMRMGKRAYDTLIDLSALGLDRITEKNDGAAVGAMVNFRTLETSAALSSCGFGILADAVRPIVGVQFRNMATVGGTVWGKYGFSDLIPALLALDAEAELYRGGRMPLADFLAAPPMKDILLGVYLPQNTKNAAYRSFRNTKTDFGVLNVAVAEKNDGTWRAAVGARPAGAIRCEEAEQALAAGDIDAACDAVQALSYGKNMRASAEYRRALSAVLLKQAYEAVKEGSK